MDSLPLVITFFFSFETFENVTEVFLANLKLMTQLAYYEKSCYDICGSSRLIFLIWFLFPVTRQQVKGNLVRLHSCVEELRCLPTEGCTRPQVELLKQAVLDSLQQYKHYIRHANLGNNLHRGSVEVRTRHTAYMLMDELSIFLIFYVPISPVLLEANEYFSWRPGP